MCMGLLLFHFLSSVSYARLELCVGRALGVGPVMRSDLVKRSMVGKWAG